MIHGDGSGEACVSRPSPSAMGFHVSNVSSIVSAFDLDFVDCLVGWDPCAGEVASQRTHHQDSATIGSKSFSIPPRSRMENNRARHFCRFRKPLDRYTGLRIAGITL